MAAVQFAVADRIIWKIGCDLVGDSCDLAVKICVVIILYLAVMTDDVSAVLSIAVCELRRPMIGLVIGNLTVKLCIVMIAYSVREMLGDLVIGPIICDLTVGFGFVMTPLMRKRIRHLNADLNIAMIGDSVIMVLNSSPQWCSICLDPVSIRLRPSRGLAKLPCGHDFHLACIGTEFNAKRKMICPNCRNEEEGRWLYASGLNHTNSFPDDFDGIVELQDAVPDVDPLRASPTPLDNMIRQVYMDPTIFWQQSASESGLRRRAPRGPDTRRRAYHPWN